MRKKKLNKSFVGSNMLLENQTNKTRWNTMPTKLWKIHMVLHYISKFIDLYEVGIPWNSIFYSRNSISFVIIRSLNVIDEFGLNAIFSTCLIWTWVRISEATYVRLFSSLWEQKIRSIKPNLVENIVWFHFCKFHCKIVTFVVSHRNWENNNNCRYDYLPAYSGL